MIAELLFCSAATGGDFFWVSSVTAIAVVAFFSTNGALFCFRVVF
ncbi:hypothetical protein MtrunA17_Chr3g0128681 [Medicago truncatula]|uniref:Transmembrane protein n=1 Tax=Medicago truncatula TaxID=3880 RepID=A0A396IVS5_MEDTR|nr:hypothetical protein MtrunA17_Chr3g0128681 [Medicago truncatula]